MNTFSLKNKHVILTGGEQGLGSGIYEALIKEEAAVSIIEGSIIIYVVLLWFIGFNPLIFYFIHCHNLICFIWLINHCSTNLIYYIDNCKFFGNYF